jgi:hypothetical protein
MNVAKFFVPDWEDIVGSGIGLSYRHARLHMLAGRYDNLTISPSQGLRIWLLAFATVILLAPESDYLLVRLFNSYIRDLCIYLHFLCLI